MKTSIVVLALLLLTVAGCTDIGPVSVGPAVHGTVLDIETQKPVEGVEISIAGRHAVTAISGNYYIADINGGTHVIQAKKAGYANYSAEVVVEDSLTQKTILLSR